MTFVASRAKQVRGLVISLLEIANGTISTSPIKRVQSFLSP